MTQNELLASRICVVYFVCCMQAIHHVSHASKTLQNNLMMNCSSFKRCGIVDGYVCKVLLTLLSSAIGLGDIPAEYTNNPNESTNAQIKANVDYKKFEVNVFCQEMKKLLDSQTHDIEGAFSMDIGPYAVSTA